MKDDTFDYESHPEWAERVEQRPDYGPKHPPRAILGIATGLAVAAILYLPGLILLMTGVLIWH